jgi:ubiquinone/menaquinone biosynthesis C-methylase UbiE
MTLVDYGCGPGRYTIPFAQKVDDKGKVYALDIHPMALKKVKEKAEKCRIENIETILVKGHDNGRYDAIIPDKTADRVFALDMFFIIKNPAEFLKEIARILKDDGLLILDDGHQSRDTTKKKISLSPLFEIIGERKDHLKLRKCNIV